MRTSRKRVARLMRENGWAGTTRGCARRPKGERKAAAPQANAAPDLVRRDFSADGPDRARFGRQSTYVRTHQGWLYLAVVMDIWSRMIVGWSMSDRMGAELADDALKMAIARRRPGKGCVHHSDHGSQYASLLLGRTMRDAGIEPSMGSISSPWDNAAMESLMGLIKAECVHARTFETREQASLEIFEYIEAFYNRVRTHSALGYLSPAEFEARASGGRRPECGVGGVNGIGVDSNPCASRASSSAASSSRLLLTYLLTVEYEPSKPFSATSRSKTLFAVWRCLYQQRLSSSSHESTSAAKGSSRGDSGALPTAGGLSERSVSLRYFLTVGSETPVSRAIEATLAPPPPEPSDIVDLVHADHFLPGLPSSQP